ncbi:hypothetical protein Btru_032755 [Bulinus truncatus]|nr:hypothetical protein Btru_032755 [Bulinus truncatus]
MTGYGYVCGRWVLVAIYVSMAVCFTLDHLPEGLPRMRMVYQVIQALADLNVKVTVTFTSLDRPEHQPGSGAVPYPVLAVPWEDHDESRDGTGVDNVTKYDGVPCAVESAGCPMTGDVAQASPSHEADLRGVSEVPRSTTPTQHKDAHHAHLPAAGFMQILGSVGWWYECPPKASTAKG